MDRHAREIVRELDKLVDDGEAIIVVPGQSDLVDPLSLEHIEFVRLGNRSGHVWEQIDFSNYLRRNRLFGVNLCNTAPISNPGLVVIHDMNVRANPDFYSAEFRFAYRVLFGKLTRHAEIIVTDSLFSKREIERFYPAATGRIVVVPCAWQHVERISSDEGYLGSLGLESGSFYFAMSSLAPNKNLKWIAETALLNPDDLFLVAGGVNERVFGEAAIPEANNVVYLGYVSDEQAKALIQGCKGFLFPTFYEGFGIPPMEALACGAPVAVSDTEVMHEIYGEAAHYVDPLVPCDDLKSLFSGSVASAESVLAEHSWRRSALSLLDEMRRA